MNKNIHSIQHRDQVLNQELKNTKQLFCPCAATLDNEILSVIQRDSSGW
jgi:hypothetical protein